MLKAMVISDGCDKDQGRSIFLKRVVRIHTTKIPECDFSPTRMWLQYQQRLFDSACLQAFGLAANTNLGCFAFFVQVIESRTSAWGPLCDLRQRKVWAEYGADGKHFQAGRDQAWV